MNDRVKRAMQGLRGAARRPQVDIGPAQLEPSVEIGEAELEPDVEIGQAELEPDSSNGITVRIGPTEYDDPAMGRCPHCGR